MAETELIPLETDQGAVPLPPEYSQETQPAEPEQVAQPETPTQETAPAAADPDAEPDPEKESDPRVKGILRTLADERRARKEAEKTAAAGMTLARKLQARPDVVALLDGQHVPTPAPQPQPQPQPAAPPAPSEPPQPPDHVLRELAESLALYGPDQKPDLQAALRIHRYTAAVSSQIAEQVATRAVQPVQQSIVHSAAQQKRNEAVQAAKHFGVDDDTMNMVLSGYTPEMLADPAQATMAVLLSVGLQAVKGKQGGTLPGVPAAPVVQTPAAPPPTFVEGATRRVPGPTTTLSALEEQQRKRLGTKPADWLGIVNKLEQAQGGTVIFEGDE